ncbi:hypothetical protein M422DRAFT_23888 [Sphaerobolus stellatus SS14]|nr:hypothetical protein M422DRAFT_23888 [Sphaerobolus stellatus SS14]
MGRPLYSSTLLARQAPAVKESTQNPSQQPQAPVIEKWSRWNAFDPDADDFFEGENAVYEAFLTEEQIAEKERLERDERARLAAERMMREGGSGTLGNGGTAASGVAEAIARSGPASGIELFFMGSPPVRVGESQTQNEPVAASGSFVPHINVDASDPLQNEATRSPSPDPLNLVSGLSHLSESPSPMHQDLPSGFISPVPDTPARVSGVFDMVSSQRSVESPSVGPVTSQLLTLYDQLGTQAWAATRSAGNAPRYRLPSVPAPLTS